MIKILNGNPILCDKIYSSKDLNLLEILKQGADLGVLIATHSMRGIGKTSTLIEFAKHSKYIVVVPSKIQALELRNKYSYEFIVEPSCLAVCESTNNFVLDEGINIKTLRKMYPNINIVTGWFDYNSNREDEKTFDERIVENLKVEIDSLYSKIKMSRDNNDFGTYKNLIIAFKEVLGLYKEMTEGNKENLSVNTFNNSFNIDKQGNVEMLGEIVCSKIKEQLGKSGIRR